MNIKRFWEIIKTKIIIRWKYRKDFRILEKVIRLGETIFQSKSIIAWDENDDFSKFVIECLAKSLHRMQSIKILCKEGLSRDAVILLRVLFENFIDFKYIYTDKRRVEDYIEYGYYQQLKMGKILLDSTAKNIDKEKIKQRNQELQGFWDGIKHRFTDKKGGICRRWSCKSLAEICDELNFTEVYNFLYKHLSNYVHPSSVVAGDYILGKKGDDVIIGIGTSEVLIEEVLPTASSIFLDILNIVNENYKMGFDKSLASLSARLTSSTTRGNRT